MLKLCMVLVIVGLDHQNKYSLTVKLQNKLLFAALALLILPVATVNFLKSLDSWLVERERTYLGERVQNLAAGIAPFMQQWSTVKTVNTGFPVFPKQLNNLPVLDGFNTEWNVVDANWIEVKNSPLRLLLGKTENYQFLFLNIVGIDNNQNIQIQVHYQQTTEQAGPQNQLKSITKIENNRYIISPEAPGKILAKNARNSIQSRINGYWQVGSKNSSLELRIPDDLILSRLKISLKVGTKFYKSDWLQIFKTESAQQKLLDLVNLSTAERLWLLGAAGEVMGVKGNLEAEHSKNRTNAVVGWLIGTVPDTVADPWSGVSQIPESLINLTRTQGVLSRIEPGINAQQKRIVALARIGTQSNPQGYLLFEKLSGTSILLSQPEVSTLINASLGLMFLTVMILLIFGGRLSWRIRQLQKQLASSMDDQGRVTDIHLASNSNDEIGELSQSMTKLLYRQKEFQDYQNRMSSRLSHELRTPVAVVRGALDNLRPVLTDEGCLQLIDRATTGIERMASLVTRMREAARLEQVINASTMEPHDINQLLANITSGFSAVWPEIDIQYQNQKPLKVIIAVELIAQALEKLLSNAVDFAKADSSILVSIQADEIQSNTSLFISVSNEGDLLPKGKEKQLTENMVSIRSQNHSEAAHLGLGLYMVKLIAQYHGGGVEIRNRRDGLGVIAGFTIKI